MCQMASGYICKMLNSFSAYIYIYIYIYIYYCYIRLNKNTFKLIVLVTVALKKDEFVLLRACFCPACFHCACFSVEIL